VRSGAALFALAASLAACSIGPRYSRPNLDVPATYRAAADTTDSRPAIEAGWWEIYKDAVLQRLLRTALEQNRDIRIAAARVAEARAQVGIARLGEIPNISLSGSGQRGRILQGRTYVTGALFGASAQVSYEADLWQRLASLSDAARASLLATQSAQDNIRVSLISDVATAYFNLLALDQQLRVTAQTVTARERFLQLTQLKFRRGAASGLDVSRAEASLALARANIPDLQRQITQTENQLQILLGQNPADVAREQLNLETLSTPPDIPPGVPSTLLERRPDLRQSEANLVAATANVRAAKAALFPTISLTGNFGVQSLELSNLFEGPAKVWAVGLGLLQPIINAQRNGYQVDAAEARRQQALLQYSQAVQQAFREVSDALAARTGYAEFRLAQEAQVNALREASRRVLRRYEIGYSSYFEVIDADTALFNAELQLIQAYRNNLVALVQLYKVLGGGWQSEPAPPS